MVDFAFPLLNLEPQGFQLHPINKDYHISVLQTFQPVVWCTWLIVFCIITALFVYMTNNSSRRINQWVNVFYDFLMRKKSLTHNTVFITAKLMIIIWSLLAICSLALFKSEFFRNLSPDKRKVAPFGTIDQLDAILVMT